jgi:hypothetical protein
MRTLTVAGGIITVFSLLALVSFVLPEIENYKNQLLLFGSLTMLAGEDAQYELLGRLNALYLLRNIAAGGVVVGAIFVLLGLSTKTKPAEAAQKTASRSSEYYIYVALAALIIIGAMAFFALSGVQAD